MCEYCHSYPHRRGCPNEPEAPIVTSCSNCHRNIREGDEYFDIDGEPWCETCIEDSRKTAEVEE